jgi:Tfp pilus assembly protein PilF
VIRRPAPDTLVAAALLAVLALTAAVYAPITGFDFVGYDDPLYVVHNPKVHDGLRASTLAWALRSFDASNWHPLTWISHALDWQLFGRAAGGHHAMGLILHLVAVAAVFAMTRALTASAGVALWTAAVFALHPLNVESVAWVAERKNVLSGLLFVAAVSAYVRYAAQPGWRRYAVVTLLVALGLAAKPAVVPLPLLLLVLDFWPLGRFERLRTTLGNTGPAVLRLSLEKVLWLALAGIDALLTIAAQAGTIEPLTTLPLPARLCVAVCGYATYLAKLVWPATTAVFYPLPRDPCGALPVAACAAVVVAVSAAAALAARRRPYLAVGWIWFVLMLVPAIGLVQVGKQFIADRYVYLPMLGLLMSVGCAAREWAAEARGRRSAAAATAVLVVLALAARTRAAVAPWHDSITLYEHAIASVPGNYLAMYNLAVIYKQRGDVNRALDYYLAAIAVRPEVDAKHEVGAMLAQAGRIDEAIPHLEAAVAADPQSPRARYNLGLALWTRGRYREAREVIAGAVALASQDAGLRGFLAEIDARLATEPKHVE